MDQALYTAVRRKLSNFFAEDRIDDVVKTTKYFAGLNTIDRLSQAACGSSLIYGEDASACGTLRGVLLAVGIRISKGEDHENTVYPQGPDCGL